MISQAYISGSLGKAFYKKGRAWFVLEAGTPDVERAWHPFDGNDLTLVDSEIITLPEETSLYEIRQTLTLETRKQEALTLALQLMDESIKQISLKTDIAKLLGEYVSRKEIFEFVENRLLTTVRPSSFYPFPAAAICHSLELPELAIMYEFLARNGISIEVFHTTWLKVARKFLGVDHTDQAWSLLTDEGIAIKFVRSMVAKDILLWENAATNATLLFQKHNFVFNAEFFSELKIGMASMQFSFKELNYIKSSLPTGGIARIARELNIDAKTVRNYFDTKRDRRDGIANIQIDPYPKGGGIGYIEDTRILDLAKKIIEESHRVRPSVN